MHGTNVKKEKGERVCKNYSSCIG